MREIKFRVWHIDKNIMSKPFDLEDFANDQDGEQGNGDFSVSYYDNNQSPPMVPNVIMQYTGLKDKNGKEIYEGDIVNFTGIVTAPNDSFGKEWHEKCIVEFESGCFKPFNAPYSNGKSAEIIGNIYENPELLIHPDH